MPAAQLRKLRECQARRWRSSTSARELEHSMVSLAALVGSPVRDPSDAVVGQLRDVVVHWMLKAGWEGRRGAATVSS